MFSELKPGPVIWPIAACFVGRAAERDLVGLLAGALEAEDADVADVVMAAGVDAAGDLDLQRTDALAPARRRRIVSAMRWATGIERAVASAQ